jgi:ATP-dependent Lon protease
MSDNNDNYYDDDESEEDHQKRKRKKRKIDDLCDQIEDYNTDIIEKLISINKIENEYQSMLTQKKQQQKKKNNNNNNDNSDSSADSSDDYYGDNNKKNKKSLRSKNKNKDDDDLNKIKRLCAKSKKNMWQLEKDHNELKSKMKLYQFRRKYGDKNLDKNKSLEERIADLDLTDDQVKIIYDKYLELQKIECSEEKSKLQRWIDLAMSLPTKCKSITVGDYENTNENKSKILGNIKQKLDQELYGMESAKKNILMIVNSILHKKEQQHLRFGIQGPAGVGKTKLISSLAKILNLPFIQIQLGSINDVCQLTGFGFTYRDSMPGMILSEIVKCKYKNPIIFLDEIDKISNRSMAITSTLIHMLDTTQDHKSHDEFLGALPFDLSNIIWMYSMNDKNRVNPILLDRLEMIDIPGYTSDDKKQILIKHLFPEAIRKHNLSSIFNGVDEDAVDLLIEKHKLPPGIRSLKQDLESIMRSFHTEFLYSYANINTKGEGKNEDKENKQDSQNKSNFNNLKCAIIRKYPCPRKLTKEIVEVFSDLKFSDENPYLNIMYT